MAINWSIQLTEPGGKPKIFRDAALLAKSDGQQYGTVVNVSFFLQAESNKAFVKVRVLFCLFPFKEFIIFSIVFYGFRDSFFFMAFAMLSAGHNITPQSIRFRKTAPAV